jgi:hypothetical protein
MIKNTGIVKAGFSRYLIDGFKRGMPPTEAMLMKKKIMLTNIRQKPIEYMSFLLNCMILESSLRTYLGSIADPMKNPANPIIRVITRLVDGLLIDRSRNNAKRNSTISGLKM